LVGSGRFIGANKVEKVIAPDQLCVSS
jgi:hypothetical protein